MQHTIVPNGSPSKNRHYHPNTRQKYINKSNLKIYFGYVFLEYWVKD